MIGYPTFLSPKTPPSAPYNASLFALSGSQLKLAWFTPLDTGGSPITVYRIEYDIVADFRNVPQNQGTNTREISVPPITGSSTYCIDIDIAPSSRTIPRFARLFAYNGYQWSGVGYPTPRSSMGEIRSPGAPIDVQALATSGTGILVTWLPPDALDCVYGGDGGSPVNQYAVEWDIR